MAIQKPEFMLMNALCVIKSIIVIHEISTVDSSSFTSRRVCPIRFPEVCLGVLKNGMPDVTSPDSTALPIVGYSAMLQHTQAKFGIFAYAPLRPAQPVQC